jgi:hypothetical protein
MSFERERRSPCGMHKAGFRNTYGNLLGGFYFQMQTAKVLFVCQEKSVLQYNGQD